ncbi:zincin-like metallopeptidase toxin domain-containing protein [Fibrella aquatilis]|uniref:Tox-MPTase4 domain-containing protein n=1 Tax=Fibrella aquatilis TaxID=2817059 RepID=A0A939G8N5_9BACT|nr:zincin-like metallopeptidase toxin domain-containing protein [Fibrella aquatilis]MBO0932106.1 hypothetical protein [Fibrella aquatilis]
MIPGLGIVPDLINAAIYAAEGDFSNAALSGFAAVPLVGDVASVAKLGKRALKVLSFKRVQQLKKFGKLDLMEVGNKWAGKLQRGSTGFLGSPRLNRRQLQAFKKQAKALGAELEVVRDKAMLRMMDAANAQAGFQAHINKLFVRKGATAYEVTHELTHAKHCAELGKDAYGKLNRLEKETHVFEQLMKHKEKLTKREIEHATDYINDIRSKLGLEQVTKL